MSWTYENSQLIRFGSRVYQNSQREIPRKWKLFKGYWKAELAPPAMKDMGAIEAKYRDLIKAYEEQRWKNLTTREFIQNTFVTIEIACWFFAGEIIGRSLAAKKWSFYGYVVPGWVKPKRDTLAG